jgi:predicted phosphate transport protein (TIGR00153 family)
VIFKDKRIDDIHGRIDDLCNLVGQVVREFGQMVGDYLDQDKAFKEETRKISELESEADRIRTGVLAHMYEGAVLPAYREDYIALVELLDDVADQAEDVGEWFYLVRPEIPEPVSGFVRDIARLTVEAYDLIPALTRRVLEEDDREIQAELERVYDLESQIDRLEFDGIRKVFKELSLDKIDKLMLKMMFDQVAEISDQTKNVAKHLNTMAVKRRMA